MLKPRSTITEQPGGRAFRSSGDSIVMCLSDALPRGEGDVAEEGQWIRVV